MPIFSIKANKLMKVKERPFENEREIQKITETNLGEIFNLELVGSEITIGNLRMDSLAFNRETKSFNIIEYKRDKNFSVIDQGYAYLSLLLNNKADIILEYNERMSRPLKREDVDWSQSRVIFISPRYTLYQRQAIEFKDLPMEIWEVKRYENDTILYSQIKVQESSESITVIGTQDEVVHKVSREVKVYSEDWHLEGIPESIIELYEEMKQRILNFGEGIELVPRKHYIGFKVNTNFIDIHPQKSQIKIWINLNIGELDDPKRIARDVSNIGHWGNGDYEIIIRPSEDIDYLMMLVKQSYKEHSL
jgi:predicted transport protein